MFNIHPIGQSVTETTPFWSRFGAQFNARLTHTLVDTALPRLPHVGRALVQRFPIEKFTIQICCLELSDAACRSFMHVSSSLIFLSVLALSETRVPHILSVRFLLLLHISTGDIVRVRVQSRLETIKM